MTAKTRILIKFPTRNRPVKFKEVFLKYQYMTSNQHDVWFLISMDHDDPTMNTPEIQAFLSKFPNVSFHYGNSKTKIEAVNADLDKAGDFDILLLASDDMIPVKPGYDNVIVTNMQKFFPDGDGVLHFNDDRVGERLNTLCVIGKKYFDRFGYIYFPGYQSVYCDNEFMDISRMLNKTIYIDEVIIRHGWIQYVGFDELAKRNEDPKFYAVDKALYDVRKSQNFGINLKEV